MKSSLKSSPDTQGLVSWRQDGREFFCRWRAGGRDVLAVSGRLGFHATGHGPRFLLILPGTSGRTVVRVLTNWGPSLKRSQRSGRAE